MRTVKRFLAYRRGTVERKAAGKERRMRTVKRFLSCRRGAVALESVLATIPLMLCLAGIFGIVQTIFAGDLLQRAAYRVARTNALAITTASDAASLESLVRQAITTEVGDWLDFELMMNAACPQPQEGQQDAAEYCLSATVQVYNSPSDMAATEDDPNGQLSQEDDAALGGGSGDMVVVRMRLQPRSALGQLQQTLFGEAGLRAIAIMRNEERIPELQEL